MVSLGFSPYFIFTSFLTTLLLDRGVHVKGNKQFPTSSPWYPSNPAEVAKKSSSNDSEALKKVLPLVTFDCRGKTGYFPDSKFNCEVFHYCQPDGARNTFHCPAHQLFNQLSMVCEEKTFHNGKLCREGSISTSKLQKLANNKKYEVVKKTTPIFKPSSNSTEAPQKLMTLEDLLSYMNSDQMGREAEPTFISRFHNAKEPEKQHSSSDSAITTPNSETNKDKKPSKAMESNLKAEGSTQTFSVTKTSSKSRTSVKKTEEEDTSAEYDAIEGRKLKKHKRIGRVLDADNGNKKEDKKKPHSHMTERSASEAPQQESSTAPSTDDTELKNHSPSLFTSDRNKTRKRKRYQGRKRKTTTTPAPGNETDTEFGFITTTVLPVMQTARHDMDATRNNAYRRRKSQRTRTRDDGHRSHKTEKVAPYTLPPLPTFENEKIETTTESMQKEEKKQSKNPWHKPKDEGLKFGEKLSELDQHHYETDFKMIEGPAPPLDYYGMKDMPNASEELLSEEYRERFQHSKDIGDLRSVHPKNSGDMRSVHSEDSGDGRSAFSKASDDVISVFSKDSGDVRPMFSKDSDDVRSNHRSKTKNHKKYSEDTAYKYGSYPEKHTTTLVENMFPPPRAESREHHSTPAQQMMISHQSKDEKPKSHGFPKATTEDPFRVTYPYIDKYQSGVQELKDLEEQRWKADSGKTQSNEKKIAVGSTFFFKDPPTPETTKKPTLQVPPTTESPDTDNVHQEKDMSKHTLAHQHLSKIMNDFFAMSSSNIPGRAHLDSTKTEDIIVPEYRIPDEDIYTGLESVSEDIEEIPPELLEVVDLITGNEKRDMKSRSSHEIIKIDGPITDSQIEKIFLDDKFDQEQDQKPSEDGSYKKIVVIPQPEDRDENRDVEESGEITSLKLEPFLKQFSEDKSLTVIPWKTEPIKRRQPTVLTAKKIPIRVIYRDQLVESIRPKPSTQKPNIKFVQTHLTSPRMKIISQDKRQPFRPVSHTYATHSQRQIILHPRTLYPPHPPPLPRKQYPFRVGYPFVTNSMSRAQNIRPIHSRRKRSIINRLRRQIRQNQNFLPFSAPVYPAFNPKFVPTFSPFKTLFSPTALHSSSSHLTPFTFPGFALAKPSQNRPHIYRPSHPRPPPVRHVTQNGHQTVIVEEVPVPIHVEVPSPNLIHPAPSVGNPSKVPPRYPGNQFRAPSPPAIQTPPLIQRPQYRFPPPPNNYPPLGMPGNARPMNYRSPLPLTGPLPPRITSQGQVYALGVTNKPILPPSNTRPERPPNGNPKPPPRIPPPKPYNPFNNVHVNGYPNFPYFQGAFTTPISNEPVAGRVMYSGYRPPKSTLGTKPTKQPTKSNKDRKASESSSNRSRSKPSQNYFEPPRPMRESHVSYTEEVLSRGRPKPSLNDFSANHKDLTSHRQNFNKNTASSDEAPRKRRPGRRRRPRPYSTTTQGTSILNEISPTPPPPEQIPPPPADFTNKPSQRDVLSSQPSFSEGTKVPESSSHFPPAGYYGKDQLVQFFDSSSKPHQKSTSPKPYHLKNLGESRANAEIDDSMTSMSMEDGNEPAFGTRLRSKPQSQSRSRQSKNKQLPRSQTQKNEVRTRPNSRPEETTEEKMGMTQTNANEGSKMQSRPDRPPPRRRRPPPPRPHNRPPPKVRPQPEVHHFNYNNPMGNFYSVPPGLGNIVAPERSQQGYRGSTDMFGLPVPVIDQNIYSLRPQGAPVDFDPNFFSVPAHVAQQQQSPLHKMNIKPVPESAREFFTPPDTEPSNIPEASAPEKKETDQRSPPNKSGGVGNEQRDPPVRKLRKPKRKNRYNPHSTEQKDSAEVNSVKPQAEQTTPRVTSTGRYREKPTTTTTTTTVEPHSTAASTNDIKTSHYHVQNDIKESSNAFKQRNIPKALPDTLPKSLLNGKIDIQKLNATISTSVSVSGAIPQTNTSSEDKENKRVFSSQNGGGLAVVKKGPKRKRARQRVSTTTGVPYVNNDSESDAKYEIAASVLDIIKATTETERQASGYYDNYYKNEKPASSKVSNTWVESPSNKRHHA